MLTLTLNNQISLQVLDFIKAALNKEHICFSGRCVSCREVEYLPMTGDLLPFMVFVLSHGFLGISVEKKKKKTVSNKEMRLLTE